MEVHDAGRDDHPAADVVVLMMQVFAAASSFPVSLTSYAAAGAVIVGGFFIFFGFRSHYKVWVAQNALTQGKKKAVAPIIKASK